MDKIKIFALGGLAEDGRNMYCIEINDSIYIIEAGLKYPEQGQLGIEMIIPDFTYLQENKKKIKGIFITHGHDDVMAALPNLIKVVNIPIYTAPLTAMMLENLFEEKGIKRYKIHRIQRNASFKVDKRQFITFGMTQSIPDAFGLAINTDQGYIVYTSEFVVDYDAKLESFKMNLDCLMDLSKKGVFALLVESVGSTQEGHSAPKHRISRMVEPYFEEAKGRIVFTMYQQNIFRAIEMIELANKYNRKIFFYDKKLVSLLKEIGELGYYHVPAGLNIPLAKFKQEDDDDLVIISGDGSTIFRKVHKIANKEDNVIEFKPSDTIILGAPAVPGTERIAVKMENALYKEGSAVYALDTKRTFSMHASIEDIKMMLYLLKPKYYIPVKGEYRQLISNANIALNMGYKADKILVLENGQIATFENGKVAKSYDYLKLEDVMVDGKENLDATGRVLKDRETLATDGAIICGVVINHKTKEIIGGPDIQSRGVIYLKDADYIMKNVGKIFEDTIIAAVKNNKYENIACRMEARDKIIKYILKETGKRPMILPAIIEINVKEQ